MGYYRGISRLFLRKFVRGFHNNMVGEQIEGSGGVALKSDILAKKIEFFKTLGEHIQLIGQRILVNDSIGGTDANTLAYTVPANTLSFVQYIQITSTNLGATLDRDLVVFLGTSSPNGLLRLNVPPNDSINYLHNFIPMLIAFSGEPFLLVRNNTNADHVANIRMLIYEIPSEISIQ